MSDPTPALPPEDLRVAEVLQKVRSGVRQRRAESTTMAGEGEETRNGLLALKQREYVQEPVPFSHRPGLGRFVVLARKAVYKLFLKWFTRPLLEQQNGFNQASARLVSALTQSWVAASDEDAGVLARAIVRLCLSYVSMPPEADHDVAADLARLMTPFVERHGVISRARSAATSWSASGGIDT